MFVNQQFEEFINQGMRDCTVVAENGTKFIYEYVMPNGKSCLRDQNNKPISYRAISRLWLRLIEDDFGIDNLIAKPQQSSSLSNTTLRQEMKQRLQGKS